MVLEAREDVIKRIARAWQEAVYPGDDRLAGQSCSCPCEYCYVAAFFKGRRWNDVTREALSNEYPGPDYACLSFMSGEALRYYLGAFMILALERLDTDDAIVESAVNALTPPAPMPPPGLNVSAMKPEERALHDTFVEKWNQNLARMTEWWRVRTGGLTAAQQEAILVFLRYKTESMRTKGYPESCLPTTVVAYWTDRVAATKT